MARYRRGRVAVARHRDVPADLSGRHKRRPYSLPLFASTAALAFAFVSVIAPDEAAQVSASAVSAPSQEVQSMSVTDDYVAQLTRDGYTVTKKVVAVPRATGDAGAAQAIAYDLVKARGWSDEEFACLVSLFNKESHWNVYAENKSSGAYGIPQALPGSKMASAGADWQTNPATQITWGLGYISGRYGTPCGAWQSAQAKGWY